MSFGNHPLLVAAKAEILKEVRRVNSRDYGSESADFKSGYDTAVSDVEDAISEAFARLSGDSK